VDASVWKSSALTNTYLTAVRASTPQLETRWGVMRRLVFANGRPVRTFLDLGCGDGILGAILLTQWPDAHGVFVDFSQPMLEAARTQLPERHVFLELDFGDPAWVAGAASHAPFDVIVSGFSIHHQDDQRKREIYQEVFDLLAPGGIFINIEHVAPATAWGERLFEDEFVDNLLTHQRAAGDTRSREDIAAAFYNRPDKAANKLAPVDIQVRWLREIGFTDADCFSKHYELCVFAGRKPV
jgi:tRNA (cmo5U34)-methyltransferase